MNNLFKSKLIYNYLQINFNLIWNSLISKFVNISEYEFKYNKIWIHVNISSYLSETGPFQPSNNMMLRFYSFYKQAILGQCDLPKPGFWDVAAKAKWFYLVHFIFTISYTHY